jgi:hypothetical protein
VAEREELNGLVVERDRRIEGDAPDGAFFGELGVLVEELTTQAHQVNAGPLRVRVDPDAQFCQRSDDEAAQRVLIHRAAPIEQLLHLVLAEGARIHDEVCHALLGLARLGDALANLPL